MPKILIVATSHSEMGQTGHRTGVWLEELAAPYYVLRDAGAEIVLASVKGGEIPFDPRSVQTPGEAPPEGEEPMPAVSRRFLEDPEAMKAAKNSPSVDGLDMAGFDAIMLPGGHGTMWDLPESAALATLVGNAFDAGKIVAAVCHGPAGLVSAKRKDGRPIVEGRRVNGFTNGEEEAVGLTQVVPFLLETRLRELGGKYECGPDFQPYAVQDGNLITGQNPMSSELVAHKILDAFAGR
ncbi:type 1 glutamine amidotransferase domain-containing protein [Azospirillum sp. SYSU D00513]|uniref:type 1 glutamine amidotransferase domain-containing protein n=1 Tax=Azospirillum sp. SYSU D00513 TaxID=2812561 RepID=UPI001A9700C3|nr:type 1 glutamine amidotransferase domain-containing protein [Azospirillum sp. SYSU D00513]